MLYEPVPEITFKDAEHIQSLQQVIGWLNIRQGRTAGWIKATTDYSQGKRSNEAILSISESFEAIELFRLWESVEAEYPGIKKHIRKVLSKGPLLTEGERGPTGKDSSANQARNDAFVVHLGGRLIYGGAEVLSVERFKKTGYTGSAYGDVTASVLGRTICIECKRTQTYKKIERRFTEGCNQLRSAGVSGIVAIDVSAAIRPSETVFHGENITDCSERIGDHLESLLRKLRRPPGNSFCRGALIFARVPTMKDTNSALVDSSGDKILTSWKPYTVCYTVATDFDRLGTAEATAATLRQGVTRMRQEHISSQQQTLSACPN